MPQREQTCRHCGDVFNILPEDLDFYGKIEVPPPTFCPDCREQRRLSFRNERSLYKRSCDLCRQETIGLVSPDKPYPMYCQKCWWSDKWDPGNYGKEYDFSRPFFEQFHELLLSVPHSAFFGSNNVNSSYLNLETDDKNCYFEVGGHFNENSAYNTYLIHGKESFDNYWTLNAELCYECIYCERCYKTLFSEECLDCRDTILSYDCRNCSDIFGCAGLRNKRYCIWNKQVTKDEYESFVKERSISSYNDLVRNKEKAREVWMSIPHRDAFVIQAERSTGHHLVQAKNAVNCWGAEDLENVKNLYLGAGLKDSYDATSVGWGELLYETACSGGLYDAKFVLYIFGGGGRADAVNSSYLQYCYNTPSCEHCFGCVNMQKQKYCILNRRCSEHEYKTLVAKIKDHMRTMPYIDSRNREYHYGEFFPSDISPFGYNETVANDYFPLNKAEATTNGFTWSDYVAGSNYETSDYSIPDDIRDVKEEILDKILKCETSGKAYRIIPMELEFYRRMDIPIPRRCPQQRHLDRTGNLLPRKLLNRTCMCAGERSETKADRTYQNTNKHIHGGKPCGTPMQTPYSPERPEIVYCQECYLKEIS